VGPAALALFVYSGQLKNSEALAWVPIDLTLVTAILASACYVVARAKNGPGIGAIAIPIILWALFLMGVPQAMPDQYTNIKLLTLYTFTLFAALVPFHLLRFPSQRKAFVISLAVIAVAAGALTLVESATGGSARLVFDGSNTIGTARVAGTGVLIFAVLAITLRGRKAHRLLFVGAAVLLLGVMLSTGSRGPFLGMMVGIVAVLLSSRVLRGRRMAGLFWSAVLLGTGFWWATSRTYYGGDRAFAWLSGERDTSTNAREYLWGASLEAMERAPFGVGWGDFSLHVGTPDSMGYPHNLFLEVFLEAGWLVGVAVTLFIVLSVVRFCRRSYTPASAALLALLAFSLVNAMVSGDINDNRLMWILLSVAWVLPPVPASTSAAGTTTLRGSSSARPAYR
jgi:O-antigen ligase